LSVRGYLAVIDQLPQPAVFLDERHPAFLPLIGQVDNPLSAAFYNALGKKQERLKAATLKLNIHPVTAWSQQRGRPFHPSSLC